MRVQTHAIVLVCTSEIGTCIINDAGRDAAHKKQRKYTFFLGGRISLNDVLYSCFEGINFKLKKKLKKQITKINDFIT